VKFNEYTTWRAKYLAKPCWHTISAGRRSEKLE